MIRGTSVFIFLIYFTYFWAWTLGIDGLFVCCRATVEELLKEYKACESADYISYVCTLYLHETFTELTGLLTRLGLDRGGGCAWQLSRMRIGVYVYISFALWLIAVTVVFGFVLRVYLPA